jgi:hypothetical protein
VWSGVCGGSEDVDESVVSEYKPKLLELIPSYEPDNITMRTKQDCFFGRYQQKSLAVKGEKCTGSQEL